MWIIDWKRLRALPFKNAALGSLVYGLALLNLNP